MLKRILELSLSQVAGLEALAATCYYHISNIEITRRPHTFHAEYGEIDWNARHSKLCCLANTWTSQKTMPG